MTANLNRPPILICLLALIFALGLDLQPPLANEPAPAGEQGQRKQTLSTIIDYHQVRGRQSQRS